MAQSYSPGSRQSAPVPTKETETVDNLMNAEEVQSAYVQHRDRLVGAIDLTKSILTELRRFNKDAWVVRYPQFTEKVVEHDTTKKKRAGARRSLSFADDPTSETEVVFRPAKGMARAMTMSAVKDVPEEKEDSMVEEKASLLSDAEAAEFNVLRLDLKLGSHGSSSSPAALVSQLEKSSIANLLDERINSSVNHVDKLRQRIQDTSSKVLVTGDLNAGKSTFVNAILRRQIMPVDQQPCTTAFCEVRDARDNDGKEEIHLVKEGVEYNVADDKTFIRRELKDLEEIVDGNENSQQVIKLYLSDARAPAESLLHNGVVDISLIDAPGLNRDSLKTTALFARQEEIDVVVFVVSAENHFTLSAKEFLWNASHEKAYIFVVVNKYAQIRNKEKCRRLVLEQIKQLSPKTYEDADNLVHFVDSAQVMDFASAHPSFDTLESCLRSFVLTKREKSKLAPASTYLTKLLSDIDLLAGANAIVAQTELERAKNDLDRARPVLEKMQNGREALEENLEAVEEDGARKSSSRTREIVGLALDKVAQGQPGVDKVLSMPTYPGILNLWDYAKDVRRVLLQSIDLAVKMAEDEARVTTARGVDAVSKLADEYLPEGVERSRRVFVPEAMFSVRPGSKAERRKSLRSVVAGGVLGLGIGLAQRPDLLETTFADLFDMQHVWVRLGLEESEDSKEDEESNATALSVVSVGVGALTMVGGQALGARGIIEGLVRVSDMLANETARKWAAPVVGAFAIGLTAYFVLELPTTVPKTIGRRIRKELVKAGDGSEMYVDAQAARVARETRKVLRLASWDLKERFRSAMEERGKEVKGAEEMEKKAGKAVEFFRSVEMRTGEVREGAVLGLVDA
ncbi:transmembrane GTPase fzo1 [Punctularia strigosozonata HHB-11173 SS5]|uniref:transmembrane GTPase fzo1 n=1 Tax=Punctularia strigosozonata (strain HHB-11173) TaxID=741275 RepID=UPI00044173F1|nr:transmembrane GTPase fzo1 [Punctularia strigosozonata HHB-11173 SS5]EIN12294.1 transmembrane GTPase fzo1 [Punctularia strigosozonata HHB-11173 SS5]